jgi:hypothetical protein
MTQEEIQKAFEGRWRLKADFGKVNRNSATMSFDEFYDYLRGLCFDFFEAGIFLTGQRKTEIVTTTPAGFEDFWNLYDKKVGRPKAEKLWAKLSEKEKADCMAYIPLYKQAQSDKQYRKNPETFLRNKSFYDEIIIRNSKDQQRSQRIAEAANLVAKYTGADKGTKG